MPLWQHNGTFKAGRFQCYSQQQNKSVTVPITLEPRMPFLTQLTSQQRVAQVAQEIVHLWVSALDRTAKVCLGAKQDTGAQLVRTPLMFLSHLYHCAVRGPAVGTCSKRHHKVKSEDNGITLCWHFLRFRISVQWQNMHIEFFAYACEAQNQLYSDKTALFLLASPACMLPMFHRHEPNGPKRTDILRTNCRVRQLYLNYVL